jgi:hypothetical protein
VEEKKEGRVVICLEWFEKTSKKLGVFTIGTYMVQVNPFCRNLNPLQGEGAGEAGGEEKGEGKKERKKRSKKTTVVEEDKQGGTKEEVEPSLIDIDSRERSPAPAAALTESSRKKSPARERKKQGELKNITVQAHTFCPALLHYTCTCTCVYHTEPVAATATATTTDQDTPTKTFSKKRSKKKGGAKAEVIPVIRTMMDEPELGEGWEGCEAREEEEGKRRRRKEEKVSYDSKSNFYYGKQLYNLSKFTLQKLKERGAIVL